MLQEAFMKVPVLRLPCILSKAMLASLVLGGVLVLTGVPAAKADSWEDCNRRVSFTEWRYHEAVEHFGPYSHQARHWAHERHEALERREHLRHEWREHHRDRDDWNRR
jgi:predicted acyl esterase